MGYIVRPDDIVKSSLHTYRILKEINKGGFADAFKAIDETGKAVFFKQYKSPTKLVPWFNKYFDYEKELNSRLKNDPILSTSSIYALETFLGIPCKSNGVKWTRNECLFQVFPFIEGNMNLADIIEKSPEKFDWEKRVYACSVFAFALRKLHDINVVHCDLKPENVQIKLDPTIAIKYRPLLIDMDWSILSDKRAPWHGKQGYVGTPGYNSPEHLKGEAPLEASDVFTAAIIFCQVLACVHPFGSKLDHDDFNKYVLSGKCDFASYKDIPFKGNVPDSLAKLIFDALNINPKKRPTMTSIHTEFMALCKTMGKPKYVPGIPETSVSKSIEKTIKEPAKNGSSNLTLIGDTGSFTISTSFIIDQTLLRNVSSQANFADGSNQFYIEKNAGNWIIKANINATNLTVMNGRVLNEVPMIINSGDILNLKGRLSGKTGMSLRMEIS
jgi:serine/threonine protein kinase